MKLSTVIVPSWESDIIKPNSPDECSSKFFRCFVVKLLVFIFDKKK